MYVYLHERHLQPVFILDTLFSIRGKNHNTRFTSLPTDPLSIYILQNLSSLCALMRNKFFCPSFLASILKVFISCTSIMLLGSILWLLSLPLAKGNTIWDYAPDFSNDAIPPYPPVKNPDGSNITTDNWRSTKLYGWKGCTNHESNEITNAYNDFDTMVNVDGTWQNIDWKSKAATDFWGPSSGRFQVPDNTRTEIQRT